MYFYAWSYRCLERHDGNSGKEWSYEKDCKDNAREYYLYNKLKEDDASKHSQGKKESSDDGKSNVGCGSVLLCFLFMFCMMWFATMVNSLCK